MKIINKLHLSPFCYHASIEHSYAECDIAIGFLSIHLSVTRW